MITPDMATGNISPLFVKNEEGSRIARELIKREATSEAIVYFAEHCDNLTDYDYWFFLSTLWVSYSGWSDIDLWKRLFSSDRPNREQCIMKPNEYRAYKALRHTETVYRAQREGETDWIAYTLKLKAARRLARVRGVAGISKYEVAKEDILALFLRRGEDEVIVLDKSKVRFTGYCE